MHHVGSLALRCLGRLININGSAPNLEMQGTSTWMSQLTACFYLQVFN
jgi:hypothetical protein